MANNIANGNNYHGKDPDSDEMEDMQRDNSFEGENKIFELKS